MKYNGDIIIVSHDVRKGLAEPFSNVGLSCREKRHFEVPTNDIFNIGRDKSIAGDIT